jgi:TRAP-type C4-dicarboxylate transport system substrate-binding protein
MDSHRWRQVTGIFHDALSCDPPARESYLAAACGRDESLRAQVEALLAAHAAAGAFGDRVAAAVDLEHSGAIDALYRAARESRHADEAAVLSHIRPELRIVVEALLEADDAGEPPARARSGRSAASRLVPGTRLGPYRIDALLAKGGAGVVYRARDPRLGRTVAIKILQPGRVADPDRERRFVQEAKAIAALNHRNIVTVYDIRSAGRLRYIAMEYVEGQSLAEAIGPTGLPLPELLRIGMQIADALAAAHSRGVVHRDIKPANVMIAPGGVVKVLDFGLAKLVESGRDDQQWQTSGPGLETMKGIILGTPSYMSPEQALGRVVDPRTDVFAFGSVLYEMATGQQAFSGASPIATLRMLIEHEPRPLRSLRRDVPDRLERIIERCQSKSPDDRFQSMAEVQQRLEALAVGEAKIPEAPSPARAPAVDEGRRQPLGHVKSRRAGILWGAALLLVAAVAVAGWRTGGGAGAEPPRPVLIRVAADFPPPPHPAAIALQAFAARVPEVIAGSEVRVYFAGELHSVPEVFQALKDGTLEFGWGQFGKTATVEPWVHALLAPGVLNTIGSIDGLDRMATAQALFDRFDTVHGIRVLGTAHMSFAIGIAAKHRITGRDQLLGRHVRSMGAVDGAQLQAWGASPRMMAFGEVAGAAHTLDGVLTSVGGWLDVKELFPYFTIAGVNGIGTDYYWLGVSRLWWNTLNEATRHVLLAIVVEEIIPLQKRLNFCVDQFSIQRFGADSPSAPGIHVLLPAESADLERLGRTRALEWLVENTPTGADGWLRRFIADAGSAVAATPPGSSWIEQTDCEDLARRGLLPGVD